MLALHPTVLAQSGPLKTIPAPEIIWSVFAPELLVLGATLTLLLMAVAGRRRNLVAIPMTIVGILIGAALIANDLSAPGGIVVATSAISGATVLGLAARPRWAHTWVAGISLVGALAMTAWQYLAIMAGESGQVVTSALQGSLALDGVALFTRITVYATTLLALMIGHGYLADRGLHKPEFEPLVLMSALGMTVAGAATDLITIFVAYEVLSISLYILAGTARRDRRSQEAGLKYFVLGAVTSAILLYGMALTYAATGSVDLAVIGQSLALVTTPDRLSVIGMVLVIVGLGFKVSLAPFQLWTPDVYQGSPTNVTAFMAAATKAAGFAIILRLFLVAYAPLQDLWVPMLAVMAAGTMLYGAIVAVLQHDVKRMLAFSSIAHAGYATIGVVSASTDGMRATLWYLFTYAIATIAAFAAVIAIERRRQGEVTLDQLRGLGRTSPALAILFSLALLSLAGIPPTAGFAGKLVVFQAGVDAGLQWLVVVGVIASVIAAFFYLRIMAMMFLEDPREDLGEPVMSGGLVYGISVAAALVLYLGLQPENLLHVADTVAQIVR